MSFRMYIMNPEMAMATEIYNAKAKSPEDILRAIRKAKEKERVFHAIFDEYTRFIKLVMKYERKVETYEEFIERYQCFIDIRVCELVSEMCSDMYNEVKSEMINDNNRLLRICFARELNNDLRSSLATRNEMRNEMVATIILQA